MSREREIAQARRLKAKDVRLTVIAKSLGVCVTRVREWTADVPWPTRVCFVCDSTFEPRHGNQKTCCGENARKRFHENQARSNCEGCGTTLGAGSGYPAGVSRCATCYQLEEAERVDARARKIEGWWAEGVPMKDIAARLGWTRYHLSQEMHRLREKGYDLPYRHIYPRPRFPEQVAA